MHAEETSTAPSAPSLNRRNNRRMYLVTYSQADTARFPTRESFAEFVVKAFMKPVEEGKCAVKVIQWACCRENHKDGGVHYHLSLKFDGPRKWYAAWKEMRESGVTVDFSDKHDVYISMYRYVCKEDDDWVQSVSHPNLAHIGSPRTKQCNAANRKRRAAAKASTSGSSSTSSSAKRSKSSKDDKVTPRRTWNNRLQNVDVGDFIVKNNILKPLQLLALADERKNQGEKDLAKFVHARTLKSISELIEKSWLLVHAKEIISNEDITRMDRLDEAYTSECVVESCTWLQSAKEVLQLNNITEREFAEAIFNSLKFGRRKFRNVMLIGRSSTAKTFMLKPLKNIFGDKLFENPARDKYGWNGIENCQVVLLQDFRYSKELIAWKDFLLMLEGETVKLPRPKNHCAEDIVIDASNDIPILATSGSRIEFSHFSPDFDRETDMMNSRWKIFEFKHVFEEKVQRNIPACGRCFAELVSMGC
jgi:hypothetical protein